ncbi:MAG: hypothetical protein GZ090_01460 [Oxalobacteraceae bacterium]|nr:hypothetical protein [Oxalobacteraceae bacterium]
MIDITLRDSGTLAALDRLISGIENTEPAMRAIGEYIMELSKRSFEKSASPSGMRWAPNTQATILQYLNQAGGNYRQDGRLSAKGAQRASGKKPLIGQSRDLARQFSYVADGNSVIISNTMVYAAMQQFGGSRAQFPHLWGSIPARPFMPVDTGGALDDAAARHAVSAVEDYINTLIG